jgi:hypothetical protein
MQFSSKIRISLIFATKFKTELPLPGLCRYGVVGGFIQFFSVYFAVILHSGTFYCPGMDLPATRDKTLHSGTVPGIPGQVVTLGPNRSLN